MIPFFRSLLKRAVHAFNLTIRPRVIWLSQPMLNTVLNINSIKDMGKRKLVFFTVGEPNAVVGEYSVQLVGYRLDEVT